MPPTSEKSFGPGFASRRLGKAGKSFGQGFWPKAKKAWVEKLVVNKRFYLF